MNFLILVFILHKVLYKPITNIIAKRRAAIEEKFKQARSEREAAEKLKSEYNLKLLEINTEENKILARARKEAETEREGLIKEARRAAEHEQARAMESLDQEIKARLADIQQHIAAAATRLAGKLLQDVTGSRFNEEIARHITEQIRGIKEKDYAPPGKENKIDAVLFAAEAPQQATVEQFRSELEKVFGLGVSVTIHLEPSMIAGFRLEIGELILDAGINRQLNDWNKDLLNSLMEHHA
ncbi:MAG: F0F1 ATP synthase subunit delta [Deltaproteobacteria bacterium]|nr:F0F1 ATP synthase subunit delta [Deltaproteobacteria bacterium]